jgi:hypothetical protein
MPGERPTFETILTQFLENRYLLPDVDPDLYREYKLFIKPINPEDARVEQLRDAANPPTPPPNSKSPAVISADQAASE